MKSDKSHTRRRTVLPIPADTHGGGTTALMMPGGWNLPDGGTHYPSKAQRIVSRQWEQGWGRVRELRKRSRLVVAHAGDAVEGDHHNTHQIIHKSVDIHEEIHTDCMDWGLQTAKFNSKRGDLLYYVHGTLAHNGTGSENNIAKDLDAVPYIEGTPERKFRDASYVFPHLKLNVNGVLFDIAHHGPTAGTRIWTQGNSLRATIKDIYYRCLDKKMPIPRYWIRAHYHEFAHEIYSGSQGTIEGFILPAFQLKTHYGHRVANHKLADIGMLIVVVEEDGRTWWECPMISYDETPVEFV